MDRISGLSDELLIKILLLVPTKVAVSTSILSKRWEFLWLWLPKLEYSDTRSSPSECSSLQCFLNRNLPLHKAPVLESFHLELHRSKFPPENVMLWVALALPHCIRELKISYDSYPEKPNILPSNLYTCKSLVTLKLDGDILLDVPRMVFLPSLKTLHLRSVRYFSDKSLQRLLSNCHVLEDLFVGIHERDIMKKLTVAVPSLQRLSLYIPYNQDMDGIVIETPSLKYLKLKDHNYYRYCLVKNMPNLIKAHIDVDIPNINGIIGSITSVKRLTICSQVLYDVDVLFHQLKQLKLCRCKEQSSNLLVRLLKDSPKLRVLDLFHMGHSLEPHVGQWNRPSTVPECMLLSLQTFKWSHYTGPPEERDLALYILKNSVHLKTATIKACEEEVSKFDMIQELALSSRASSTCQLVFTCTSVFE